MTDDVIELMNKVGEAINQSPGEQRRKDAWAALEALARSSEPARMAAVANLEAQLRNAQAATARAEEAHRSALLSLARALEREHRSTGGTAEAIDTALAPAGHETTEVAKLVCQVSDAVAKLAVLAGTRGRVADPPPHD